MANDRTFYACQAVAMSLQPSGGCAPMTTGYQFIKGVQSVGINSNFEFDQLYELGQIEVYDTVGKMPKIEVTIEKVLDEFISPYTIMATGTTLMMDSKSYATIQFALWSDLVNASGSTALKTVKCKDMVVNSVSYTFPLDGPCKESITLGGFAAEWGNSTFYAGAATPGATGTGLPIGSGAGTVMLRKDVVATLPQGSSKAQSITLSVDLGREDLMELGRYAPYARVPNYPVEVTAEIEYLANEVTAPTFTVTQDSTDLPIVDQTISVTAGKYTVALGNKCFCKSVTYGGGDAGGGNATVKYSYATYNTFNAHYTP